jgi:hypothetical protein
MRLLASVPGCGQGRVKRARLAPSAVAPCPKWLLLTALGPWLGSRVQECRAARVCVHNKIKSRCNLCICPHFQEQGKVGQCADCKKALRDKEKCVLPSRVLRFASVIIRLLVGRCWESRPLRGRRQEEASHGWRKCERRAASGLAPALRSRRPS